MAERVLYTVADGIATLTLRDPPANTYSYEMMRELDDAILRARMDAAVLVLRSDGDEFFCAGADIKMRAGADMPLASGLALERERQQQLFISDDAREGISAYVAKRTPNFKGR